MAQAHDGHWQQQKSGAAPAPAHGAPPGSGPARVPLIPVRTAEGGWLALPLDAPSDDPFHAFVKRRGVAAGDTSATLWNDFQRHQETHGAVADPPAEAVCEAAAAAAPPPPPPRVFAQGPAAVPLPLPVPDYAPEAPRVEPTPHGLPDAPQTERCGDAADAPPPEPEEEAPRAPERRMTSRHNTLRAPPAYLRPPPGVAPVMVPMTLSASMHLPPLPPAAAFARAAEEARRAGVPSFAAPMTWPMSYYAQPEPYGVAASMLPPPLPLMLPDSAMPLAQLCRFWAAGCCAAGAACRFWHSDGGAPWGGAAVDPYRAQFAYPFATWMPPPMPAYFAPFATHPPPPAPPPAAPPRAGRRAPEAAPPAEAVDAEEAAQAARRKAERLALRLRRQSETPCKFFFSDAGCCRAVCRFAHVDAAPPPA